jgi:endoglucanase
MLKKSFGGALNVQRMSRLLGAAKSIFLLTLSLFVAGQSSYGAPNPFLSASGLNIRNNYGQGDIVPLHGVNLGSWLLMEGWMCPMDSSGLADNYSVIQTLDSRFGVAAEQSLIQTYQNTWITTNDLDNIKALGMNYIRLPFWWGDIQTLGGAWRPDAFAQMDWLVTNAWQRGIYVLIDFHGVPGGQSTSQDTGYENQNQYWTNVTDQLQTTLIWSNVAAHFNGNPAVLGYDLINEPVGAPSQAAIWTAYNSLYQTVRTVDPNHIIVMEGCWSGTGTSGQQLNWQWDVLPPPAQYGWTNVVYSMHAYSSGSDTPANEVNKQVNDFNSHQSWNVPCLIGEFNWEDNTASYWQYGTLQFNANNMNWSHWSYKATSGSVPNSWGIYDPIGTWPPTPNIQSNSITSISNDWSAWKTGSAFGATSFLVQYLGGPIAVADFYTNSGTLTVNSNSGVLDNDQDINLGQPGISLTAVLVSNPANGQLVLSTNGSFTYTPNAGFTGTDTFRYRDFDGFVNSVNIATVSILVTNNAAGPATQLIWTTQPGLATNGVPFGQQPVLQTADAFGNPSTNSLPASLIVTVTQSAGNGPLLGTTNFDIGTAAGNGVVNFANLQINSAGTNNQLMASVLLSPSTSLLLNGNFNSPNSGGSPTSWTTWTVDNTAGAAYANHEILPSSSLVDTADGGSGAPNNTGNYDGSYQMSLGATASDGSGAGVYQIVGGSPNVQYTLVVDGGAQGWWWPTGEIRLFFLNSSGAGMATNVIYTTMGINSYNFGVPYQPWTNSAVSPAGTTQVKVEFAGYGGGTCWFDNAVLIQSNSLPTLTAETTLPFAVYPPASQTNAVLNMINNNNGTFTLNFVGTVGVTYYVQMTTNLSPPIYWLPQTGSTNTVTNSSGLWFYTTTNSAPQSYFRSVVAY